MLARADQILYTRKRAIKKVQGRSSIDDKAALEPDLHIDAKQLPLHVLVDLTCPHCQKKNAVAVIQDAGPSQALHEKVSCAYCKTPGSLLFPGPSWPAHFQNELCAGASNLVSPFPIWGKAGVVATRTRAGYTHAFS